ncbi:hypothetical protein BDY24DRAFT_417028 [Mrakia frigida]|uniref:BRcat and Rcat domain-containing protein n=1 Tax=Mrakia frigida TaxID=29902 RepID=UPI003FCC2005
MTTLTLSPPPPPSAPSQEPQALSEDAQAIFEILAIDVSDFESLIVAEQLQIEETLAFSLSAEVASSSSFSSLEEIDAAVVEEARKEAYVVDMAQLQEDLLLALSLTKDDAQLEADATLARNLGNTAVPPQVALDRMVAEQVAAGERKIAVDRTFAEHLHRANERNLDIDKLGDAEKELGIDVVQGIINAQDPNSKGKEKAKPDPASSSAPVDQPVPSTSKGKGKAVDIAPQVEDPVDASIPKSVLSTPDPLRQCGICWDVCRPVFNPLKSSSAATSSSHVSLGIQLSCGHSYCLTDAIAYLCGYLDGDGGSLMAVFPICCPECHDGRDAFEDTVAEAILDETNMERWWRARILDSIPKMYCSNKKCNALVVGPDSANATQAQCPCCEEQMCVQCQTKWHSDLSCEEFQSLPEDERSIEDSQLFGLAEGKKWGRCPKCRAIVERALGCNHITCRCRQEFCYSCGTEWDRSKGTCPKGCDLFYIPPDIPGIRRAMAQPRPRTLFGNRTAGPVQTWVAAHGGLVGRAQHLYTSSIVASRTCPACSEKFATDQALFEHLDSATHPVHFHCGMIFASALALEEHNRLVHGGEGA